MYDRHLGRCEGFVVDGEWIKKPKGLSEEEWWGAVNDIKVREVVERTRTIGT